MQLVFKLEVHKTDILTQTRLLLNDDADMVTRVE